MLFARDEYQPGFKAFLLAFTCMVAIQFASSLVLMLTGFHQVLHARGLVWDVFLRRNLVSIIILAVLSVILTGNLQHVVETRLSMVMACYISTASSDWFPADEGKSALSLSSRAHIIASMLSMAIDHMISTGRCMSHVESSKRSARGENSSSFCHSMISTGILGIGKSLNEASP